MVVKRCVPDNRVQSGCRRVVFYGGGDFDFPEMEVWFIDAHNGDMEV